VNGLRDKARSAFYPIKRNIKFDIPIKIWLKILESVIEPITLYGCEVWGHKNSENGTNTKLRLCMQKFSKKYPLCKTVKHQIMHAEQK
jgi:hypothetical protein